MGIPATRPVVEMTIPSALDKTLAPPGKHVVQVGLEEFEGFSWVGTGLELRSSCI